MSYDCKYGSARYAAPCDVCPNSSRCRHVPRYRVWYNLGGGEPHLERTIGNTDDIEEAGRLWLEAEQGPKEIWDNEESRFVNPEMEIDCVAEDFERWYTEMADKERIRTETLPATELKPIKVAAVTDETSPIVTVTIKGAAPSPFCKWYRHPVWWWQLRHLRRDTRLLEEEVDPAISKRMRELEDDAFLFGGGGGV